MTQRAASLVDARPGKDPRILALIEPGKVVLDVGCGAGTFLDDVRHRFDLAVGIDRYTRRLHARDGVAEGWEFVQGDLATHLPLAPGSVDLVLANQVIEHILDPVGFARAVLDVLAPGGRFIVTTPNVRYLKHVYRLLVKGRGPRTANDDDRDGVWDDGHVHYFTHDDVAQILSDAGFETVSNSALIELQGGRIRPLLNRYRTSRVVRELLSGNMLITADKALA